MKKGVIKDRVSGSDRVIKRTVLPQLNLDLYRVMRSDIKDIINGSDGDIKRDILPQLIDEIYSVIKREI